MPVRAERRARAGALDLVCRTAEGIVLCPTNFFDYMMVRPPRTVQMLRDAPLRPPGCISGICDNALRARAQYKDPAAEAVRLMNDPNKGLTVRPWRRACALRGSHSKPVSY